MADRRPSGSVLSDRTNVTHDTFNQPLSLSAMLAHATTLNHITPVTTTTDCTPTTHHQHTNNSSSAGAVAGGSAGGSSTFLTSTNDIHSPSTKHRTLTHPSPTPPTRYYTLDNTKIVLPHIPHIQHNNTVQAIDTYPSHKSKQPKLLTSIQTYIQAQLATIDPHTSTDAQLHAQHTVYTNALHMFAVEFAVYQPVLQAIQGQYTAYVQYLIKQCRDIQHYKSELAHAHAVQAAKLADRDGVHHSTVAALTHNMDGLKHQLHSANMSTSDAMGRLQASTQLCDKLQLNIAQLQQTNKTLVASLKRYEQQAVQDEQRYNAASEQMNELKQELHTIQTNYYNLIDELHLTRTDRAHAAQQQADSAELTAVRSELTALKQAYDKQTAEYNALVELYDGVQADVELNKQSTDAASQLLVSNTPRPQWRTVLTDRHMPQLIPTNFNIVKTTSEYITDLFNEIDVLKNELHEYHTRFPSLSEIDEQTKAESSAVNKNIRAAWLKCRGEDDTVPKWLRAKGRIRNRLMSKRETELFIKEVWSSKYGNSEYKTMDLNDYMYVLLKNKHTVQDKIVEYAYNFMDALDRYSDDPDCMLILSVLQRVVPEQLYMDQCNMVSNLQQELVKLDVKLNKKTKHRLTRKQLLDFFTLYFHTKCDENMKLVNIALYKTDMHNDIHYLNLFSESREGDQTVWLECVRAQHLNEVFDFTHMFYGRLRDYTPSERQVKVLTVGVIRQIFRVIDGEKRDDEVDVIVRAGLKVSEYGGDGVKDEMVVEDIEQFIMNCSGVLIKRSGRPEGQAAAGVAVSPSGKGTTPDMGMTPQQVGRPMGSVLGLPSSQTTTPASGIRQLSLDRVKSSGGKHLSLDRVKSGGK